jgi:PqqD family protein of HPr-rel-A system
MWVRRGPDLVWQELSAAIAVFDPSTGETHFLTELPALVLKAMDATAASEAELIRRIAGPVALEDHSLQSVHAALNQLERAELIEHVEAQAE